MTREIKNILFGGTNPFLQTSSIKIWFSINIRIFLRRDKENTNRTLAKIIFIVRAISPNFFHYRPQRNKIIIRWLLIEMVAYCMENTGLKQSSKRKRRHDLKANWAAPVYYSQKKRGQWPIDRAARRQQDAGNEANNHHENGHGISCSLPWKKEGMNVWKYRSR